MKKVFPFFFLLLFMFIASACGNAENPVPQEETPPAEEIHYYDPLTNAEVAEPIQRRLIVISIDNHYAARPQYGIGDADILYEVPAEGMIPRLIGIFYGRMPELVGGVRSARPYIIDIAREWDAVMVHCGGSEDALAYLAGGVVDDLDEIRNGSYFWRDDTHSAPHDLVTSGESIYQALADKGYAAVSDNVRQLTFRKSWEPVVGEKVDHIEVDYNYAKNVFTYDSSAGCYYRSTDGEPFVDGNDGEPIYAANIIVQMITSYVTDSEGHLSIDMCEGGDALLFTAGKVIHGSWHRADLDSPTFFVDGSGNQFRLGTGPTWIELVDSNTGLDYYNAAEEGSDE
ncbi:MAG: DUF3048 domain-containing protein [Firmicutes bacterium]|nr:DUF3048 domain-containing protein [Bacillota bacterium]